MKITSVPTLNDFLDALSKTKGEVWLEAIEDGKRTLKLSLKSQLSMYVAIGELIKDSRDGKFFEELELYCSNKEDEAIFLKFFNEHKDAL